MLLLTMMMIPYLRHHGLHIGDLHLSPHSSGRVSQAPHLLQGHVVFIIDVKNERIVRFSKSMEHVVEPQAVPVVAW